METVLYDDLRRKYMEHLWAEYAKCDRRRDIARTVSAIFSIIGILNLVVITVSGALGIGRQTFIYTMSVAIVGLITSILCAFINFMAGKKRAMLSGHIVNCENLREV